METTEKVTQTSIPSPTIDRPSPYHTTQTSAVSDFSRRSSETLSVEKLDSLFQDSLKIMVRRSDSVEEKHFPRRLNRPAQDKSLRSDNRPCLLEGCRGATSKFPSLRHHGGRPQANIKPTLCLEGISSFPSQELFQPFHSAYKGFEIGKVGYLVEQKLPYRPLAKSAAARPIRTRTTRSRTIPTPGARHCDACSIRDLRTWFEVNPLEPEMMVRSKTDISPRNIHREKSQVFFVNQPTRPEVVGENMAEVLLPMATVPKKGLIQLSSRMEDHTMHTRESDQVRRLPSYRREATRQLIRNKSILKGIKETYKVILENEQLELEQTNKLVNNIRLASSTTSNMTV